MIIHPSDPKVPGPAGGASDRSAAATGSLSPSASTFFSMETLAALARQATILLDLVPTDRRSFFSNLRGILNQLTRRLKPGGAEANRTGYPPDTTDEG